MCMRTDLCTEKYLERVWNTQHNILSFTFILFGRLLGRSFER